MAQVRVVLPLVRQRGGWRTVVASAMASVVALTVGSVTAQASTRPPWHIDPVISPGFGVPDEPDGPQQGGMLKPLSRPQVTTVVRGTPRPPALTPQQIRLLKVRRIGR